MSICEGAGNHLRQGTKHRSKRQFDLIVFGEPMSFLDYFWSTGESDGWTTIKLVPARMTMQKDCMAHVPWAT